MSYRTSSNSSKKPATNKQVSSSIVHKPFDTGTINIFNPPRSNPNGESLSSKLVLNAALEKPAPPAELNAQLDSTTVEKRWLDQILTPWGISAIALLLLANVISGVMIWRNPQRLVSTAELNNNSSNKTLAVVGGSNLAQQEFVSLNLNNLSTISSENSINSTQTLIKPEIAASSSIPLAQINPKYYYIVSEYTGDRSLKSARKQVKSVSLVNFPQGVFVYLGAFTEENAANDFVTKLKQTGVEAFIYPLD